MSEKIKLYKEIENFINAKCAHKKNPPFEIFYRPKDAGTNDLPVLFDKNYYIQCILSLPTEKEEELNKNEKATKVLVTESHFELALYKDNESENIIKCLLIVIINSIEIEDQKEVGKFDKNLIDINNDYKLLEKLKKFMFEHIKLNKNLQAKGDKEKDKEKNATGNILEKILLGQSKDDLKFFNDKAWNIDYNDENIKAYIVKIKSVPSKLEIKLKHSDKVDKSNVKASTNKNILTEVLDDLSPDYKKELIDNYLDEMPEELVELMRKYRKVNITNDCYSQFINNIDEDPKDEDAGADDDDEDEK